MFSLLIIKRIYQVLESGILRLCETVPILGTVEELQEAVLTNNSNGLNLLDCNLIDPIQGHRLFIQHPADCIRDFHIHFLHKHYR